jgi:uncharacterized membrane protein
VRPAPDPRHGLEVMEEWLHLVTKNVVVIIDAMALVVVVIGTAEAFFVGLGIAFRAPASDHRLREVWLRYGRWLVAGLTFQLAADIIGTSIAPSWEAIGQLGAIALTRTFLNFFLERDLADVRNLAAGPVVARRVERGGEDLDLR